mgnify:CR=1
MGLFFKGKRLLGIMLICLGTGILMVLILPFWGWLAIASICIICAGWFIMRKI